MKVWTCKHKGFQRKRMTFWDAECLARCLMNWDRNLEKDRYWYIILTD